MKNRISTAAQVGSSRTGRCASRSSAAAATSAELRLVSPNARLSINPMFVPVGNGYMGHLVCFPHYGPASADERAQMLGAATYRFIGARQRLSTTFTIFLREIPQGFDGVAGVTLENGRVKVIGRGASIGK